MTLSFPEAKQMDFVPRERSMLLDIWTSYPTGDDCNRVVKELEKIDSPLASTSTISRDHFVAMIAALAQGFEVVIFATSSFPASKVEMVLVTDSSCRHPSKPQPKSGQNAAVINTHDRLLLHHKSEIGELLQHNKDVSYKVEKLLSQRSQPGKDNIRRWELRNSGKEPAKDHCNRNSTTKKEFAEVTWDKSKNSIPAERPRTSDDESSGWESEFDGLVFVAACGNDSDDEAVITAAAAAGGFAQQRDQVP